MNDKIFGAGLFGIDAFAAEVETYISEGLPKFDIVGLPDSAVRESRDRVRAALTNCGFSFPPSRITVNLAPADIKKSGVLYDLPILLSVLAKSGQLNADFDGLMFVGELSLSGEIRPAAGVLPMVIKARELGFKGIFIPEKNAPEGAVVEGIEVYPAKNVLNVVDHLTGFSKIPPASPEDYPPSVPVFPRSAARRRPKEPSRWLRRGDTTCCSSALPARAKVCLQRDFREFFPT